jgi:hypothetical protein
MSFFNFFGSEKKDKEYISDQRVIHFTTNTNPNENDYMCIPFNKNLTCEDIINNENFKKRIEDRFHGIQNNKFHFSIIDPKNKFTELKLSNKDKPYKYLGFEYMLCYLPDNNKYNNNNIQLLNKTKNIKKKNIEIILQNKVIYKWNSIRNKFEKLTVSLTNQFFIIERNPVFKMEISDDFIVNPTITSSSEGIRKDMKLNGNENIIEIIYQSQPLIFNCYKKDIYNTWINNLDKVIINYKLSTYQNRVKDKLNEYSNFILTIIEKSEFIDYILNFFLMNKIWEDHSLNENDIIEKSGINLISNIFKYKNLIRNKKYIEGWMCFIQIVSIMEEIEEHIKINSNNEKIINKLKEYIQFKNNIHLEIQKFQNNSKQINDDSLSELFKIEIFDELIDYYLSNKYWTEILKNLKYIGLNKDERINYLTNKLSKFMASKFMNEFNFHGKEILKFNNNYGTMSARINIFNGLQKVTNS